MFVNMPLINSQLGYTLSLYPQCGPAVFFDVSIASFGNADPFVPNRRRPSPTISYLLSGSGLTMDCCLLVLDKHLDGIYQARFYTPNLQHFRCYSSSFSPPKSPLSHTPPRCLISSRCPTAKALSWKLSRMTSLPTMLNF